MQIKLWLQSDEAQQKTGIDWAFVRAMQLLVGERVEFPLYRSEGDHQLVAEELYATMVQMVDTLSRGTLRTTFVPHATSFMMEAVPTGKLPRE